MRRSAALGVSSVSSDRRASARAASFVNRLHSPQTAAWRSSPPTANPIPATSRSTRWPGCCAPVSRSTASKMSGAGTSPGRAPDADPEDLLLLDDLLGIRDPARRAARHRGRRPTTAPHRRWSMPHRWPARDPALYVIEDAHWIDEVSESMLADFMSVIPQTPSMVLITYRPEYRGALARMPGAQTIALRRSTPRRPRADRRVAGRRFLDQGLAAASPTRRRQPVLRRGDRARPGRTRRRSTADAAYLLPGRRRRHHVPATLQATIAARIDRLDARPNER